MGAHALAAVQELESPPPFAASRERFDQLVDTMASSKALTMTHRELEDLLTVEGR